MPIDRALADALIEVVRERMAGRGLSVTALAAALGMNQPTLSRQLRGQGNLTIDEWAAVADALGFSDLEDMLAEARTKM
jgi:plasmid maintenance system antidote protein VapI